jgi:heme exporter protein D
MMPDLGKYAQAVLSSYAVSITFLVLLVGISVLRARKVRRELAETEQRVRRNG